MSKKVRGVIEETKPANNSNEEKVTKLNNKIAQLERTNRVLSQLSNDRNERICQLEIEVATYKTINSKTV
ncbi:hypothetical protein ABHC39_05750 [Pediococcus acidilactici]|uniref:hypothetical protein n=1 Tax=Pediococcus acidilactici TaxID=1254 RepID=UPI0001BEDDA1|nr:hypothetical protein [Pediococcus acidilactici]ARW24624.1 hypothetical protein S100424_01188 [Pediococcus acidilactici]ARW26666.1 hypothetical protein S100313_01231 [Pediococcus acidilactici]ARW28742.1 hypothetical protein S101189_01188 [Pediococcus acidilactici]EFA26039.1 hypothetical protein HMPREF9024_01539 [Pediococcus acidilactici 7_4]MDB8867561.1 hypothetical protein [Pediococcus acidilactici]